MIIRAKRIHNVSRYLGSIPAGTAIIVGHPVSSSESIHRLGFPASLDLNHALVPSAVFGPISAFNANGKHLIHRDQPLETVYLSVYSTWEDWNGDSHSGYVHRPYKRRPRTFIPPPGVEVKIAATVDGEKFIATERIAHEPLNLEAIKHRINLLLEIFGECEILTANLERIIEAPVKRLNWKLLPPGVRPFEQLAQEVRPIIERSRRGEQPQVTSRFEVINSYQPTFVAIGQAGFAGYVVFGFPEKGVFMFESIFFGNATYVFGNDWEDLSQLTKADILDRKLALDRIIHREDWESEIGRVLF